MPSASFQLLARMSCFEKPSCGEVWQIASDSSHCGVSFEWLRYIVQWYTIRADGATVFFLMERCQCSFVQKLKNSSSWNLQKTRAAFKQSLGGEIPHELPTQDAARSGMDPFLRSRSPEH